VIAFPARSFTPAPTIIVSVPDIVPTVTVTVFPSALRDTALGVAVPVKLAGITVDSSSFSLKVIATLVVDFSYADSTVGATVSVTSSPANSLALKRFTEFPDASWI